MSEKDINPDNGLNETQPSEMGVSPGTGMGNEQPEPGRQQATARRGWGYRINKIVMECYDRSNLTKRGYRKRNNRVNSKQQSNIQGTFALMDGSQIWKWRRYNMELSNP